MEFSEYVIYVDESGDHNLLQTNQAYPIFALAFCIFKKSDYVSSIVPSLQDLKFRWFGHDAFVLHEREIRKREKPFDVLTPKAKYDAFMSEISNLVSATPMTLIAAVIDKNKHKARYALASGEYHRVGTLWRRRR